MVVKSAGWNKKISLLVLINGIWVVGRRERCHLLLLKRHSTEHSSRCSSFLCGGMYRRYSSSPLKQGEMCMTEPARMKADSDRFWGIVREGHHRTRQTRTLPEAMTPIASSSRPATPSLRTTRTSSGAWSALAACCGCRLDALVRPQI